MTKRGAFMLRIRYETILEELEEALAFCSTLGLEERVTSGRFQQYRERLMGLIRRVEFPTPEHLKACMESLEFGDVLRHARTCDPNALQRALKVVLQGPVDQSDENINSNHPRNTMFELNIAAKLSRAQFTPILGEPDVICDVEGKRLFIPCKRPFLESRIKYLIGKAKGQISRARQQRNAPVGARGVIAISLTKILNPADQPLEYFGEHEAQEYFERELCRISDQTRAAWTTHTKELIGIIFHIITAGVDTATELFVQVDQSIAHCLAERGTRDDQVFRSLCKALEAIAR
jgi:hypothetical protein